MIRCPDLYGQLSSQMYERAHIVGKHSPYDPIPHFECPQRRTQIWYIIITSSHVHSVVRGSVTASFCGIRCDRRPAPALEIDYTCALDTGRTNSVQLIHSHKTRCVSARVQFVSVQVVCKTTTSSSCASSKKGSKLGSHRHRRNRIPKASLLSCSI